MNTVISAKWWHHWYDHTYDAHMVFSDRPDTIYVSHASRWAGDPSSIARRYADGLVNLSHEERVAQVNRFRDIERG